MKISVIGTGYVGLVTGTCFAETGLDVTCVDIDQNKIKCLNRGEIPIHEPGLDALVSINVSEGRLHFTTNLTEAVVNSEIVFIAVGTPPGEDGDADMQYVLAAAKQIGACLKKYTVIVNKSTVPVGTAEMVRDAIQQEINKRQISIEFDVVSNPEFLKSGAAIQDFLKPDRTIIGVESERAKEKMRVLYAPFNRNHDRTMYMGIRDAEMTKYAANSMLATKISFINEIAALCDLLNVDVENVRRGIGADQRIGFHFIYPGCGYGGSCFPKYVRALMNTAEKHGFEPMLLEAVDNRNRIQKRVLFEKIVSRFGTDLNGNVFGVWGLSFKPGTDDMREATSLALIEDLLAAGATAKVYDPVAMNSAVNDFPAEWVETGKVQFSDNQYDALSNSDAMVLVTEWKQFVFPDFPAMRKMMKQPIIFDGRNQYDPAMVKAEGFEYYGIGRR